MLTGVTSGHPAENPAATVTATSDPGFPNRDARRQRKLPYRVTHCHRDQRMGRVLNPLDKRDLLICRAAAVIADELLGTCIELHDPLSRTYITLQKNCPIEFNNYIYNEYINALSITYGHGLVRNSLNITICQRFSKLLGTVGPASGTSLATSGQSRRPLRSSYEDQNERLNDAFAHHEFLTDRIRNTLPFTGR